MRDFEGLWSLSREITDTRAGTTGRFDGTARFTPDGDGLLYVETGQLVLSGALPMQAERRYIWRIDGNAIAVDFDDGRPFHTFAPAAPEASHWCDPDSYAVTYAFEDWPVWSSSWRVRGPRKDYEMTSIYARIAG